MLNSWLCLLVSYSFFREMKPAVSTLWSPALVCSEGGAEAAMMLGGPRWRDGGGGLEEAAGESGGSDGRRFALQ